jgi:hypothetical protein
MTPAPSLSETLAELNNLCQFFADAEARLKNGQVVDLAGVDDRVAAVCKTVETAIPEQQKEYLPELTVLINLLNTYEAGLKSWHEVQKSQQG